VRACVRACGRACVRERSWRIVTHSRGTPEALRAEERNSNKNVQRHTHTRARADYFLRLTFIRRPVARLQAWRMFFSRFSPQSTITRYKSPRVRRLEPKGSASVSSISLVRVARTSRNTLGSVLERPAWLRKLPVLRSIIDTLIRITKSGARDEIHRAEEVSLLERG